MIINKKIKRNMLESKAQYLGSLLLIVLSGLLFTMFNQLSVNMAQILQSFEKNYVQEDAYFILDKRLSNIAFLEAEFEMKVEEAGTFDYEVSDEKTLRIFSQNVKVNLPALMKGGNLEKSSILIDPSYAKANSLEIGDSLEIYNRSFRINGFMSLPNYIYPLKAETDILTDPNHFGIAVMHKDDFDEMNKGTRFYSVKFASEAERNAKIAQLKAYLAEQGIKILKWINTDENSRITFVSAKMSGIDQISSSMPIAILLLTCILTGIVMLRLLKREAAIIGTLYALGYKKKEIMNHYLRYPLFIALVGGIVGTALGALALKPMLNVMVSYFNMPINTITYNLMFVAIGILLPVVFLIICSYYVVNKSLKYSPVELMRGGREKNKVGYIERKLKLEKLRFSTKFKIREQLRSVARSLFLLLGVILATMLLLLGFAAKSSMDYLMKDAFEEAFQYKYHYVFNSLQYGVPESGEAFSEVLVAPKLDENINFAVYGIHPDSKLVTLTDKTGNKINADQIIITRPLADRLNIKQQGVIKVINKLDSKEYDIKVDRIAETYIGNYIYMPLGEFNDIFNYPADSYIGLWTIEKQNISEDRLLAMVTVDDLKNAFDSMTQPLQTTIGAISLLAFLIGLIVIYIVTSLIIEENRGNISLMKVLGYRKKEVYALILNSSAIMIVLGYIVGIPLLLISLEVMFQSMTQNMSISIPVTINYPYILLGFVLIYLTYEISKLLSRKKIDRITMAEALKSRVE